MARLEEAECACLWLIGLPAVRFAGEADAELARWWEAFSLADHDERKDLLEAARKQEAGKRQTRASAPAAARGAPSTGDADTGPDDVAAPAKKRRRRRRKPAGEGAGATSGGAAE